MIAPEQPSHKLDNHLILLLEDLNDRKSRIDQQAHFLSHLPKILPFHPLPPASSNVSHHTWEAWWLEHDRIEREADIFRADEFALMKKVAMSKTTNMSREDTDLVGLTLGTLEAFSKLEHLLRSRRKQLQILDLRIKWDHQTKKLWSDLKELQLEQPKFLSRIRWAPPAHSDHPTSNPSSPLLRQSLNGQIPNPLSSPFPPPSTTSSSSFRSRRQSSCQSSQPRRTSGRLSLSSFHDEYVSDQSQFGSSFVRLDQARTPARSPNNSDYRTPSPTSLSIKSASNPENPSNESTHHSNSSTSRMSSIPSTPTPSLSSSMTSPSISMQSRAMRIQSLALQLSSITTKFNSLNRSLIPTSATIDRLIDSGLHLPEIFLDEQDRLEAAVRALESTETLRFYTTLLDQYKEADEIWYTQRALEAEIESLRRESESHLSATRPTRNRLVQITNKFDGLSRSHQKDIKRIEGFSRLPTHTLYPDQVQLNQCVLDQLRAGSDRTQQRLDHLAESIRFYRLANNAIERSQDIRLSMEECKTKFSNLILRLQDLDHSHPDRPYLFSDYHCLHPNPNGQEAVYDQTWSEIEAGLREQLVVAVKLLDITNSVLIDLNTPGVDPNIKSETELIKDSLRLKTEEIRKLMDRRQKSIAQLKSVRQDWERLLMVENALVQLRDRLLFDISRDKWNKAPSPSATPSRENATHIPDVLGLGEELVSEQSSLRTTNIHSAIVLRSSADSLKLIQDLESHITSTLDILLDSNYHLVHQHISVMFKSLTDQKLPELSHLELLRQQIQNQTQQVEGVVSQNEAYSLEAGRLMKRVQDSIAVELDRTYEESPQSPTADRSRQKLVARVVEYLEEVKTFVGSLVNRVSLVPTSTAASFSSSDGLSVLNLTSHDADIRLLLNGMSMNLLGLRDHLSNEFSLLLWIDGDYSKLFTEALADVKKKTKAVTEDLEGIMLRLQQWSELLDSDRMQPPITEDEVESKTDVLIKALECQLNDINLQISQSTSKKLEDFIVACPTVPTSNLYKPDQFILPKQMSHHQLQSLYNATSRRLEIVKSRLQIFVTEVNARRKTEFDWRLQWKSTLATSVEECQDIEQQVRATEVNINSLESELESWKTGKFLPRLESDLMDQSMFPDYSADMELFKCRASTIDETVASLHVRLEAVNSQITAIRQEISDRLPPDIYLMVESTDYMSQIWPQWSSVQRSTQRLDQLIGRLQTLAENRRAEWDLRADWNERCTQILSVDLADIDGRIEECERRSSDQISQWFTEQSKLAPNDAFRISVEALRSLARDRRDDVHLCKTAMRLATSKIVTISEESVRLSESELPHPYLTRVELERARINSRLTSCSGKIIEAESRVIQRIVECDHQRSSDEDTSLTDQVHGDQISMEMARLQEWIDCQLAPFLTQIRAQSQQVSHLQSIADDIQQRSRAHQTRTPMCSSVSASSVLNDQDNQVKEKVASIMNLVELTTNTRARLSDLETDKLQLHSGIELLMNTLPAVCISKLNLTLQEHTFITSDQTQSSAVIENPLKTLRDRLENIIQQVNSMLKEAEQAREACKQQKVVSNAMLRILDRLNGLDLDRWVSPQNNAKHAPLPTRFTLTDIGDVLRGLRDEITDVSQTDHMIDVVLLDQVTSIYDAQQIKLKRLECLTEFHDAAQACDHVFSQLLDALDAASTQNESTDLSDCATEALASLQNVSNRACAVANDTRVEYQLERLTQTWAELSEMVKDPLSENAPPKSNANGCTGSPSLPSPTSVSPSKIPVLSRSLSRLRMDTIQSESPYTPPRPRTPKLPALPVSQRLHHALPLSPSEFVQASPSYVASRRSGQRTPDPVSARLKHSSEAQPPLRSRPPSSLGHARGLGRSVNRLKTRTSVTSMTPPGSRVAFGTSTPTPMISSTPLSRKATKAPYMPQPNRNIDRIVGNVVNRLAVEVHVAPAEGWEDNSGMYWIGEKVYFCRILRSQTVMVRIGGGWNELSSFLLEHSKQTVAVTPERADGKVECAIPRANGPERWITADEVRRASGEHKLLLPPHELSLTPRARTVSQLSSQPGRHLALTPKIMATPPEAIQLYLRKAETHSHFGTPTPLVGKQAHWRP